MPSIRSAASVSVTISRYRGSKMCRARKTLGKRTTLGNGKSGRKSDMVRGAGCEVLGAVLGAGSRVMVVGCWLLGAEVQEPGPHSAPITLPPAPHPAPRTQHSAPVSLMNRFRLLVHVVHQHILPERVGRREVRLALADVGHAAHEAHQVVV